MKLHSSACERNREPILAQLRTLFASRSKVLEIGSGTGQHAAYFCPQLPHLQWQSSDLAGNHASILAWRAECGAANFLPPLLLDVSQAWPRIDGVDAVFSANTSHIMPWPAVQAMLRQVGLLLPAGGLFVLYGPFNQEGGFTSPGNAEFDATLRARDPQMGLRAREDIQALAHQAGMRTHAMLAMPANNQMLVFERVGLGC
ncbi:DUF938 domain-containing protein [Massilia sp. W12]|uniref:DUF938 domain-containing protein n=1 Tax=Massilia sp. W12 TaxID=3126507 RepID=UPI0030D4948A